MVTGNKTKGLSHSFGGTVLSYGDNRIDGNGDDEVPMTIPLK